MEYPLHCLLVFVMLLAGVMRVALCSVSEAYRCSLVFLSLSLMSLLQEKNICGTCFTSVVCFELLLFMALCQTRVVVFELGRYDDVYDGLTVRLLSKGCEG
jgi:hypothetical protein